MIIILVLAGLALLAAYMRFEAGWVKTIRVDLSQGADAICVLQLSDIHINHLAASWDRIKRIIDRENPDVILITGDLLERMCDASKYLEFHKKVISGRFCAACLGNHDYKAFEGEPAGLRKFIADLEMLGTKVLVNSSVNLEIKGRKYSITGIDDIRYGNPEIEQALSMIARNTEIRLGMAHNPDTVLGIPEGKLDVLFCGHFHGGQFWAPFNLEFRILRHDRLCREGVKRGLHRVKGTSLYVNRGLGGVLVPLRFLSRPEITVVRI